MPRAPSRWPRRRTAARPPHGGRSARSAWRPGRSSRSGGWRPGPAPLSPWKYSWNGMWSRQCGSVWKSGDRRRRRAAGRPASRRKSPRQARATGRRRRPQRAACRPEPVGQLDLEVVAVVAVVLAQRLDQQEVDREPDRTAPVRVAAVESGCRLGRLVSDLVARRRRHRKGCSWCPRQRADAVIGEELARVEQAAQHALHLAASARVSRRWPPLPGWSAGRALPARSGGSAGTISCARRNRGSPFHVPGSMAMTASSGITPTNERTSQGLRRPPRAGRDVVDRTRHRRPTCRSRRQCR